MQKMWFTFIIGITMWFSVAAAIGSRPQSKFLNVQYYDSQDGTCTGKKTVGSSLASGSCLPAACSRRVLAEIIETASNGSDSVASIIEADILTTFKSYFNLETSSKNSTAKSKLDSLQGSYSIASTGISFPDNQLFLASYMIYYDDKYCTNWNQDTSDYVELQGYFSGKCYNRFPNHDQYDYSITLDPSLYIPGYAD